MMEVMDPLLGNRYCPNLLLCHFERRKAEMRLKKGSFGIPVSGAIVLRTMAETDKPSLYAICCPSLLISPLPTLEGKMGVFGEFCQLK